MVKAVKKYNVILYRLNRSTTPTAVLEALEALISKHSVHYSECLLNITACICELEHEGKLRSNRNRNAINAILKRHPELKDYYHSTRNQQENGYFTENIVISNFSFDDFLSNGEIRYDLIRDLVKQIPRPYGVNDLDLIYNGVSFGKKDMESAKIKPSESGFDSPVGNYIWYERSKYGDEKHSHVTFSADDDNLALMRKFFFEFAETVPGKYEGTEYHG